VAAGWAVGRDDFAEGFRARLVGGERVEAVQLLAAPEFVGGCLGATGQQDER